MNSAISSACIPDRPSVRVTVAAREPFTGLSYPFGQTLYNMLKDPPCIYWSKFNFIWTVSKVISRKHRYLVAGISFTKFTLYQITGYVYFKLWNVNGPEGKTICKPLFAS